MGSARSKICACSPGIGGGPRALSISEHELTRLRIWTERRTYMRRWFCHVRCKRVVSGYRGRDASRVESAQGKFSATNASGLFIHLFIRINSDATFSLTASRGDRTSPFLTVHFDMAANFFQTRAPTKKKSGKDKEPTSNPSLQPWVEK